jgi:hypothetical protein
MNELTSAIVDSTDSSDVSYANEVIDSTSIRSGSCGMEGRGLALQAEPCSVGTRGAQSCVSDTTGVGAVASSKGSRATYRVSGAANISAAGGKQAIPDSSDTGETRSGYAGRTGSAGESQQGSGIAQETEVTCCLCGGPSMNTLAARDRDGVNSPLKAPVRCPDTNSRGLPSTYSQVAFHFGALDTSTCSPFPKRGVAHARP